MPVQEITPRDNLGLERGQVLIAIPVFGSYDLFVQCLRSVLKHTPPSIPLMVADDCSPDPAIRHFVEQLERARTLSHTLYYMRQPDNVGFVANMNTAFAIADPADVISLNSDTVVADGWFEALREAAHSDSLVATASTLTNHGTIVSVPNRNNPQPQLPQDWTFEQAAEAIKRSSLKLYPRIPTGIGHCLYIKRSALDLVGDFDEAFTPGYGEEVDFSQRCVLSGMTHVVADDVLVLHHGMGTFGVEGAASTRQAAHDEIISSRYPYYDQWVRNVASEQDSPLAQSLSAASRGMSGITVTIDGRVLTRFVTGTQLHTLELIAALAERPGIDLRVLIPLDLGDYAKSVLDELPIKTLRPSDMPVEIERTQIVHRPYQISSAADMTLLEMLGERIVITQQDLIAYTNPGYHPNFHTWWEYRELTRNALAMADQVLFFSLHSAKSAVAEGLLDAQQTAVVYLGTDHAMVDAAGKPRPPRAMRRNNGTPFLLCLGTDFRHKNRRFALKLFESLKTRHRWDGKLVFAGPHVGEGSSSGQEAEYMTFNPKLERDVIDLAAVSENEKAWLYENTSAVLYPSVYEGFGLLPFEAAEAHTPCLFSSNSSLGELLPSELGLLIQWDADASADLVIPVLTDGESRARHLQMLELAAASLTWNRVGTDVAAVYERLMSTPKRQHATAFSGAATEFMLSRKAGSNGGGDLMVAVPGGAYSAELRRALLGIASRKVLRTLIFGPLMLGYRISYFFKNGRRAPKHNAEQ